MDIIPLGLSSFRFKTKTVSVVTDPYDPEMVGLKFPKHTTADIITVSHPHPDHNFISGVEPVEGSKAPVAFLWPGEFEAKGIDIIGTPTFHDNKNGAERGTNTIFEFVIDGIHLVHCGDLGHTLSEAQLESIENCHILFVPVGGVYTIDAEGARQVVEKLEPDIVIPMHYQRPGLNPKVFGTLSPVTNFLKEMGQEAVTPVGKLTITKDKLPDKLQVVVLE
jgi:L-ascorbate metabolism protein UlaG (beta-lactamase superfamily)